MTAIVVLGMHRSGTSCLAGMLAAAGVASAGEAVRNWDNARGHHEMLDVVRLDEAVLAYSGGHYLAPPAEVRWTDAHAAERDRLLRLRVDGLPALLKDPRMLLVLPFWRASSIRAIGIVRHPLAVARSLEAWRGMPLVEAIALTTAHLRALAADHTRHGTPILDFQQPAHVFVAAVAAMFPGADRDALASAYDDRLVHHDDADVPDVPGLAAAIALYEQLAAHHGDVTFAADTPRGRRPFPRGAMAAFADELATGAIDRALDAARTALAAVDDGAAVLVPVVSALVKRSAHAAALALIAEQATRLDDGLADLLVGKVQLASNQAAAAVRQLEAACAAARPMFQARHLLPQALRAAGRHGDARITMQRVASEALYPHGPLATLAEWAWLDGDRHGALAQIAEAITAAPPHRRGRLRTRRAEWLLATGDRETARAELLAAIDEDPGYARSREILATTT